MQHTQAELTEANYQAWAKKFHAAETSIKDRDEKRCVCLDWCGGDGAIEEWSSPLPSS
jgi:truncated hemoglobin YjbI